MKNIFISPVVLLGAFSLASCHETFKNFPTNDAPTIYKSKVLDHFIVSGDTVVVNSVVARYTGTTNSSMRFRELENISDLQEIYDFAAGRKCTSNISPSEPRMATLDCINFRSLTSEGISKLQSARGYYKKGPGQYFINRGPEQRIELNNL